jgi:hypothetical protein
MSGVLPVCLNLPDNTYMSVRGRDATTLLHRKKLDIYI